MGSGLSVCSGLGSFALGERPCRQVPDGDGGGAFGRRSPRWGRHLRAPPTTAWAVLWAKALSSSWTSDSGATGVVTSLEASLLETQHSLKSVAKGGDGYLQADVLQGG